MGTGGSLEIQLLREKTKPEFQTGILEKNHVMNQINGKHLNFKLITKNSVKYDEPMILDNAE